MMFDPHEVQCYYSSKFPHGKFGGTREWRMACPVHGGKDLNFAINPSNGLAQCHSRCGKGWDIISLEEELSGLDFIRAKDRVYDIIGRPKVPFEEREFEAVYDYTDVKGTLIYQVIRKLGKKFVQRMPNWNGGWIWGLKDALRVPYHLPRLHNSEFAAIVEGEKDVHTLERLGMVATCNNGGAGNFKSELVEHFAGKHIAIFPDNDQAGRDHAMKVAALLAMAAKSIKIVELPNLPEKGDVSDFVSAGGTIDQIRDHYRMAQQWSPEFEFASDVPAESDKYVRSFREEVELAGGLTAFWDLAKLTGIETPWRKLSRILGGGMRPGEVYILGANQGSGKTSLALQFMKSAMMRHEGVLMFSMEMGWRDVYQRMAASEARVDLNEMRDYQYILRRKEATPEERAEAQRCLNPLIVAVSRSTADLVEFPMLVSTKPSVTPEHIIEETQRLIRKKNKIRFVVIDHMQLMGTTGNVRGDYEKFTTISRLMKQVAVELQVPLLLVSQTNRAQAKDHRAEVDVSDLRGSGALEEDAGAVMLLYEDANDRTQAINEGGNRYTKGPLKCFLKVGKNRFGEQGRCIELYHHKSTTHFEIPEEMA